MSEPCEDLQFIDFCLPVVLSLLAVASMSTLAFFKFWSSKSPEEEEEEEEDEQEQEQEQEEEEEEISRPKKPKKRRPRRPHDLSLGNGNGPREQSTVRSQSHARLEVHFESKYFIPSEARPESQSPRSETNESTFHVNKISNDLSPIDETDLSEEGNSAINVENEEKYKLNKLVSAIYEKAIKEAIIPHNCSTMAAIAITSTEDPNYVNVVCITTGSGLKKRFKSVPRISLTDCRAEVLIRRCFVYFLYNQLELIANNAIDCDLVLERRQDLRGFKLKRHLEVYLMLTELSPDDANEANKGTSSEAAAVKSSRRRKASTGNHYRAAPGTDMSRSRYLSMSSPDKIALWSALGLQGALLSHYLEPIHLKGLVIHSHNSAKELQEALDTRLQGWNEKFYSGHGFRAPIPRVRGYEEEGNGWRAPRRASWRLSQIISEWGFRSEKQGRQTHANNNNNNLNNGEDFATNWIRGAAEREIIYYETGNTVNGKVSRLCKASLFDRFASLSFGRSLALMPGSSFRPIYPIYYGHLKRCAQPYAGKKGQLVGHLKDNRFLPFDWIKAPSQDDNFRAFDVK